MATICPMRSHTRFPRARWRVAAGMDDQDRVVSRRVRNPTNADPNDESVYEAADPYPENESEPSRSG